MKCKFLQLKEDNCNRFDDDDKSESDDIPLHEDMDDTDYI